MSTVAPARRLAEAVTPAAGATGAVAGAAAGLALAAAGLADAAAAARDGWDEAGGTAAQALALHRRARALITSSAERYAQARELLASRGPEMGSALEASLEGPLALAAAAADLAELAAVATGHVRPEQRPEALAAARTGAAVSAIAADAVAINLLVAPGDLRLEVARSSCARAERALALAS